MLGKKFYLHIELAPGLSGGASRPGLNTGLTPLLSGSHNYNTTVLYSSVNRFIWLEVNYQLNSSNTTRYQLSHAYNRFLDMASSSRVKNRKN